MAVKGYVAHYSLEKLKHGPNVDAYPACKCSPTMHAQVW